MKFYFNYDRTIIGGGLPGGGMDPGESLSECTVREVYEETGLCVHVSCLIKVYSDISDYTVVQYPDGNLIQYVAAVYICHKDSGTLATSEESLDIGYFDPSQFPEKTVLSTKLRVNDALRHIYEHNCSTTG
ncbi:MAG: NUDIX domain-containing protein [Dehalococcoidia bacterium]